MSTDPVAASALYVGSNQGRSNLYAGTNPSSTSLGARPATVNQTLGWQSNYTVPYHYRVARWTGGYDKSLKNGQLAFIRNPPNHTVRRQHHVQEVTMMNLPMVNYQLYRDALNRQKNSAPGQTNKSEVDVAQDILETFHFMGSIINEGAPFAVDEGGGQGNTQARIINLCVRGRQSTFNVWGDIRDGDQLYLKLTKQNVAGTEFQLDINSYGTGMPETQLINCYQFVPDYNRNHSWSYKDFSTGFSHNTEDNHQVHYINIGRCFRTQRHQKFDMSLKEQALRTRSVLDMVSKAPQFEILIDPCVM